MTDEPMIPRLRESEDGALGPFGEIVLGKSPDLLFSRAPLDWTGPTRSSSFETGRKLELGEFASALRRAHIFDNTRVELPGATVVLPHGMKMVARFAAIVRAHYESCGLEEHDYPLIGPQESYEPLRSVFPLTDRLLYAATEQGLRDGKARGILNPSGEAVIYTDWRQRVRTPGDLPIAMYRNARFFRPARAGKRSGMGIFRSLETADVFEFHCCDLPERSRGHFANYSRMFLDIHAAMRVPVLWSSRPVWTNQGGKIAHTIFGADVALPTMATMQIGCLYDQRDILSRPYGIRYRDENGWMHPYHVTGAIPRRLLLAHLMLGMNDDGSLLVHPSLAPDQVALIARPECGSFVRALSGTLAARGIRSKVFPCVSPSDVGRRQRRAVEEAAPIVLIVQPPRGGETHHRLIWRRSDTGMEATSHHSDVNEELVSLAVLLLAEIGACYDARGQGLVARQCHLVERKEEAREIALAGRVAFLPATIEESTAREVENWRSGELIGYVRGEGLRSCGFTGRPTQGVALISRRS